MLKRLSWEKIAAANAVYMIYYYLVVRMLVQHILRKPIPKICFFPILNHCAKILPSKRKTFIVRQRFLHQIYDIFITSRNCRLFFINYYRCYELHNKMQASSRFNSIKSRNSFLFVI